MYVMVATPLEAGPERTERWKAILEWLRGSAVTARLVGAADGGRRESLDLLRLERPLALVEEEYAAWLGHVGGMKFNHKTFPRDVDGAMLPAIDKVNEVMSSHPSIFRLE